MKMTETSSIDISTINGSAIDESEDGDAAYVMADTSHYDIQFPTVKCGQYSPHPYLFRIKDANQQLIHLDPDQCNKLRVRCPDFHVLFDHTIAILWLCYSQQHSPSGLSAVQIQWAVKFLNGIKNSRGEQSADVRTAIEHLEEVIFAKYNGTDQSLLKPGQSLPNLNTKDSQCNSCLPKEPESFTLNDMLNKYCPEKLVKILTLGVGTTSSSYTDVDALSKTTRQSH